MSTTQQAPANPTAAADNTPAADPVDDPTPTAVFTNEMERERKLHTLTRGKLFLRSFVAILATLLLVLPLAFSIGMTSMTARKFTVDFGHYFTVLFNLLKENWGLLVVAVVAFLLYRGVRLLGKKLNGGVTVSVPTMFMVFIIIVLATLLVWENLPHVSFGWITSAGFGIAMLVIAAVPAGLISLFVPSAPKGSTHNH